MNVIAKKAKGKGEKVKVRQLLYYEFQAMTYPDFCFLPFSLLIE